MSKLFPRASRGFTLLELVITIVVLAILVLVICPTLTYARAQARTVVCENILQGFGAGMLTYATDNAGYIPGVNTSSVALSVKKYTHEGMNVPTMSVQIWDWMTPVVQYLGAPPAQRAARWYYLRSEFRCPLQTATAPIFNLPGSPDAADFVPYQDSFPACSYLMPHYFSVWGQSHQNEFLATCEGFPRDVRAMVPPSAWPVVNADFNARLDQVGPPARKIFAADGTRFVSDTGFVSTDVSPWPSLFGGFADLGGWEPICTAYGAKLGSANYDGDPVPEGSPSQGLNLSLSYRHPRTPARGPATGVGPDPNAGDSLPSSERELGNAEATAFPPGSAWNNRGCVNIVCFDGHVERLDDRASRDIDRWYPTGSVVPRNYAGMTTEAAGYVIP